MVNFLITQHFVFYFRIALFCDVTAVYRLVAIDRNLVAIIGRHQHVRTALDLASITFIHFFSSIGLS